MAAVRGQRSSGPQPVRDSRASSPDRPWCLPQVSTTMPYFPRAFGLRWLLADERQQKKTLAIPGSKSLRRHVPREGVGVHYPSQPTILDERNITDPFFKDERLEARRVEWLIPFS